MTLAWAIIIVALLFLLHKYQLLGKALRIAGIVAAVLIVSTLAWLGWNHVRASWKQHKANVEFAAQNECLDPSTGNVHPVNPSGEPWCALFETIHERGTPIDQWALITALPTVPDGEYIVRAGVNMSLDPGPEFGRYPPARLVLCLVDR
jgi:hypothetical protein